MHCRRESENKKNMVTVGLTLKIKTMRELTRTYATWQIAVKKLVGCNKNEDVEVEVE